jgi:hypothetical protein
MIKKIPSQDLMSTVFKEELKVYVQIPVLNFFLAACLGLTLRYAFVWEIPWIKYKHVMHAHSHVAMLGWAYMILSFFVWRVFARGLRNRTYNALFAVGELSVIGMMISFPIQGYGLYSIAFSTTFLLAALYYLYLVLRQLSNRKGADITLMKTAISWFVISTLGVWAMGPIMAGRGIASLYYYMAIQFFLHFQFNGWFTFVILALFFNQIREMGIPFSERDFRRFYLLMTTSCVLTFALALSWAEPDEALFVSNGLGVILQLLSLVFFLRTINGSARRAFRAKMESFPFLFYQVAFVSFVAKIIIQSAVVIPAIAVISYTIRLYVLGFIHLILLGSITAFVLGYGFSIGAIQYKRLVSRLGWILLLSGFVLTETILFGQGTMLWAGLGYLQHYYLLIFLISILLPLGTLLGLLGNIGSIKLAFTKTTLNV